MLMLSATPGVQAMDNAPSATKLVLTGVLSTPLRVPKSSVPKRPPVPVLTEHPGTTVALTLKDWEVTALASQFIINPTIRAKKGCTTPSALSRRHKHNRSEEHTSELQSRENLVCRLLLEKKK